MTTKSITRRDIIKFSGAAGAAAGMGLAGLRHSDPADAPAAQSVQGESIPGCSQAKNHLQLKPFAVGVAAVMALLPERANCQVPVSWEAAQHFQFNIEWVSVEPVLPSGRNVVSVLFSVTDPTEPGHPWNIKSDLPFVQPPSLSRLAVDVGWNTADYNNTGSANEALLPIPWGSGAGAALPISIDALRSSVLVGDKYLVRAALPVQAQGSGTVAMEGRLAWPVEVDGQQVLARVPVKSAYRHFAITDAAPVARREIVAISKCMACHDGEVHGTVEIPRLSLHGNNRTEELRVCVICHNPNQTDIPYRRFGAEESVDFKRMIHAIHGTKRRVTPYVVIGFGGSTNDYSDVRFPGVVADCLTCHIDVNGRGTFELPMPRSVQGSTISTRSVPGTFVDVDPANNLRITPTAAVCSSCHDNEKARLHMTASRQGGAFGVLQSDIDSGRVRERCVDCHGPGRDKDVRRVHQIEGD